MSAEGIVFRDNERPDIETIIALYNDAFLVRPVDEPERLQRMYDCSPLVLTAWDGERLVGILRGWSDRGFVGYIADLAIDPQYQRRGIGKTLLDLAVGTCNQVQFALRAADTATFYYSHLGWKKIENGWYWPRTS